MEIKAMNEWFNLEEIISIHHLNFFDIYREASGKDASDGEIIEFIVNNENEEIDFNKSDLFIKYISEASFWDGNIDDITVLTIISLCFSEFEESKKEHYAKLFSSNIIKEFTKELYTNGIILMEVGHINRSSELVSRLDMLKTKEIINYSLYTNTYSQFKTQKDFLINFKNSGVLLNEENYFENIPHITKIIKKKLVSSKDQCIKDSTYSYKNAIEDINTMDMIFASIVNKMLNSKNEEKHSATLN
jgi:hypothetical protein